MTPLVIITARTASKRLPGKILADIEGKTLCQRLGERLIGAFPIVWCIPKGKEDNPLAMELQLLGYEVFRGDYDNVHKRIIDCADKYKFKTIVRVTGDNPLTDPVILIKMVNTHWLQGNDYTYVQDVPRGTRCEVVEVSRMRKTCNHPEHLTHDFMTYEKKGQLFTGIGHEELRLTVDYPVDLERVRKIYRELGDKPCLAEIISMVSSEHGQIKSTEN